MSTDDTCVEPSSPRMDGPANDGSTAQPMPSRLNPMAREWSHSSATTAVNVRPTHHTVSQESVGNTPTLQSSPRLGIVADDECFRTVCITGIAQNVAAYDVVRDLDFGIITHISPTVLVPTCGVRTLCVAFLHAASAIRCIESFRVKRTNRTTVEGKYFGIGTNIEVHLMPTLPLSPPLHALVSAGSVTRILRFSRLSTLITTTSIAQILTYIGTRWTNILAMEDMRRGETQHDVRVHFNSLAGAIRAFQIAQLDALFDDCTVTFDDDPADCADAGAADRSTRGPRVPKQPLPDWIRYDVAELESSRAFRRRRWWEINGPAVRSAKAGTDVDDDGACRESSETLKGEATSSGIGEGGGMEAGEVNTTPGTAEEPVDDKVLIHGLDAVSIEREEFDTNSSGKDGRTVLNIMDE